MGDRVQWCLSLVLSLAVALVWAPGAACAAGAETDEATEATPESAATVENDSDRTKEGAGPAEDVAEGESVPGGTAGLRVVVDPVTGRIVGEPRAAVSRSFQIDREMLLALSRSHDGLFVEERPDGTVMVDLQGGFQSASMVTRDEDGKLVFGHVVLAPSSAAGESGETAPMEPEQ